MFWVFESLQPAICVCARAVDGSTSHWNTVHAITTRRDLRATEEHTRRKNSEPQKNTNAPRCLLGRKVTEEYHAADRSKRLNRPRRPRACTRSRGRALL